MSEPIHIQAADGYQLHGKLWRSQHVLQTSPVVIINCATSVRSRYYARFADAMHACGCTVLTYDYRGIGDSRQGSLRSLRAGWLDWGELDFEAVLRYVHNRFEGEPIYVVGHSVGGFLIGLAPSSHRIARIFTMGAQYAYWPDYKPQARTKMFLQWHIAMPVLARLFGFVPARRLGWMEDTPKGVALDWARMGPRFEQSLGRRYRQNLTPASTLLKRFAQVNAPILALGIEDDPFGTPAALDRLLDYYVRSERHHLRIAPGAIEQKDIGHFAFFHDRFRDSLWPIAFRWLLQQDWDPALGTVTRVHPPLIDSETSQSQ